MSASESPISAVRSETRAVRNFISSVASVMGITSCRMEDAARHIGLPSTNQFYQKCDSFYEYMFVIVFELKIEQYVQNHECKRRRTLNGKINAGKYDRSKEQTNTGWVASPSDRRPPRHASPGLWLCGDQQSQVVRKDLDCPFARGECDEAR